jgi:hydrogenase maturation protease
MRSTTLVLGIGNTLLGDDGAGVHALSHIERRLDGREGVTLLDGGTSSFTLLPTLDNFNGLIVIDATCLDCAPGSVRCFEGPAMDEVLGRPRRSVHEIGLRDLLNMARLVGRLPPRRALIGIEPAEIGWSSLPTAMVSEALEDAAAAALELIRRWADEPLIDPQDGGMPARAGGAFA